MARYPKSRGAIDDVVDRWRVGSLIGDQSLLGSTPDVWSQANVDDLYQRFIKQPFLGKEGGGTFESKWRRQLEDVSAGVRQLAAELLFVHFLFPSSVSRERKRHLIALTLEDDSPEATGDLTALDTAIGNPGIGFNTRRDLQLGMIIEFTRALKALDSNQRRAVLADPWKTRDFAEKVPSENRREMMHILLHLLHPDTFERIASGTHKRQIVKAFEDLSPPEAGETQRVDERLLAIRKRLEELLPDGNTGDGEVDFYYAPLKSVWSSGALDSGEGTGDLEALQWKKQLILYGPPGTGKTFTARRLAEELLSNAALKLWGTQQYLNNPLALKQAIANNFRTLQLHPGYGYAEFIRGVRLSGQETRYEDGVLFEILDAHATQDIRDSDGHQLSALPFVLLLDEINRTDLTAMLGEAFSLFERDKRGQKLTLPGVNAGEEPRTLSLPEDLYVIGTMNEIDHSVETLDFALRRRFLWRACPFDRVALIQIIERRWKSDIPSRFAFDDALPQLERFADAAQAINDEIALLEDLGGAYQIGHTYFADITFFLGQWLEGKQRSYATTPLWLENGAARPPVSDLWSRSLKPLLEQYLLATDRPEATLTRLREMFVKR